MQSCDARRWNYVRCLVASQRCRLATLLASTLPKFCLDSRTEVLVDEKLWILLLVIDILHHLHRMMKTSSTILSRMERTLEIGRFTCVWYFMICLWLFWSWTFVYHCETSPSMMKTQMLSRRPKWFLQGSCWWMNSDSHWNILYKTRFLIVLPLFGKIICFKLVELTTYIVWPRWEEDTKYVPGTNWKTHSWVLIKIMRRHDDKLKKTMFVLDSDGNQKTDIQWLYIINWGCAINIFAQPQPQPQQKKQQQQTSKLFPVDSGKLGPLGMEPLLSRRRFRG